MKNITRSLCSALFAGALLLPTATPALAGLPVEVNGQKLPTLAPMLKQVLPGVVNVSTRTRIRVEQNPLLNDPFFRHFFNIPNQPQPRERVSQSLGSGVIVDAARGYVLTNNHVVAKADSITVTLRDGRHFKAKVVGVDAPTDVAVIQIKADHLTAVPFANSDQLQVGDFVVAIGNPFGLGQTVTSGIVSALGRSGLGIEGYEDFIQTDASINPGNSGGALVNLYGQLVGINTAILGPSGGNVGIGFAIPANMAHDVMEQLIKHGSVKRGRLGVVAQNLTSDLADALNLPAGRGALITQVEHDSPAAKAGMHAGDVVTAIDREPVASAGQMRNRIGLLRVGSHISLDVLRNGKTLHLQATITAPTQTQAAGAKLDNRLAGAALGDIEPNNPLYGKTQGVEILQVQRFSPAWNAGLRSGDVVVSVNRQQVNSVEDVRKALKLGRNGILLNLQRGDSALFVVIR